MMNYKLYLDDERTPKFDGWTVVRTVADFKSCIERNGLPMAISFDHDLGSDMLTGYDAVKWLVYNKKFDLRKVDINIHSANPIGRDNIQGLLDSWAKFLMNNKD